MLVSDFYESYTFKIYRDQENIDILENYIVTFYDEDTYVQNIITYPWDAVDERWDIANATVIVIDDPDLLSRNFNDCGAMEIAVTEWVEDCTDFACESGDHSGTEDQEECNYKGAGMPYTECDGG